MPSVSPCRGTPSSRRVGGESDGDRTRGNDVADDQRPSAEERHALTEGGKRIGVCAARRRDERCQLRVGETDEHTGGDLLQ